MSGLFPVLAKMAAELLDRELQVLADSPRADSEGGGCGKHRGQRHG